VGSDEQILDTLHGSAAVWGRRNRKKRRRQVKNERTKRTTTTIGFGVLPTKTTKECRELLSSLGESHSSSEGFTEVLGRPDGSPLPIPTSVLVSAASAAVMLAVLSDVKSSK
jgi:hypothetical protein